MRALSLLAVLSFALLTLWPHAGSALSARQIGALIDEYAADSTSDDRRAAIVEALAAERETRTYSALRRAAREDDSRWRICQLVAALDHPKAWDILGDYLTSEDQPDVIDALLVVGDAESLRELTREWDRADTDSPLFLLLADGFAVAAHEGRLDAGTIAFFARWLDADGRDVARRDAAAAVVGPALGLGDRADAEDVAGAWDANVGTWTLQAAGHELPRGDRRRAVRDVMDDVAWPDPADAPRRGANVALSPDNGKVWLPASVLDAAGAPTRDHSVRLHLLLASADARVRIEYHTGGLEWAMWLDRDAARAWIETGDNPPREFGIPLQRGIREGAEWAELALVTTLQDADELERHLDPLLDGTDLRSAGGGPTLLCSGRLHGVAIEVEAGHVITGGWSLTVDN